MEEGSMKFNAISFPWQAYVWTNAISIFIPHSPPTRFKIETEIPSFKEIAAAKYIFTAPLKFCQMKLITFKFRRLFYTRW